LLFFGYFCPHKNSVIVQREGLVSLNAKGQIRERCWNGFFKIVERTLVVFFGIDPADAPAQAMMNFLVMNYFVHDWPSDYHSTGKNKAAYEKKRLIDLPHITTIVEHVVVPLLPDNSSVIPLGELTTNISRQNCSPNQCG